MMLHRCMKTVLGFFAALAMIATFTGCDSAPGARPADGALADASSPRDAGPARESSAPALDGSADDGSSVDGSSVDRGSTSDPCASGGSGGPSADVENGTYKHPDGRQGKYHLYLAPGVSRPGLLVYLHGDGAYSFDNPTYQLAKIVKQARAHGLLTLAARTPAADDTWWKAGAENATYLQRLLDDVVLSKLDVDRRRVVLAGFSGGAGFVTSWYIPAHGEALACDGGAMIFGGGGPPYDGALKNRTYDPGFVAAFRLHFHTGTADSLHSHAVKGAAHYRDKGFSVTEEHPDGVGHLDLPIPEIIGQQLSGDFL